MAEQADARDLKSLGFKNHVGSIPTNPIEGKNMSKTKTNTKKKIKKKVKKASFKQIDPKFDWAKKFKLKSVKKSIAKMVSECLHSEECLLSENMKDDAFATTLVSYAPKCAAYLPSNVVIDENKVKSLGLIHQLAFDKQKERSPWSRSPNIDFIASAIALMSKGVNEIHFSYSGGTDEISSNDDIICEWIDREYESWENQLNDSNEMSEWLKSQDGCCEPIDMLYSFLDDGGAGPPEYSQSFKITFFKWGHETYGYEEDQDDWQEEEDE